MTDASRITGERSAGSPPHPLSLPLTADWADGRYTFRLTVPGAIELEEKCGGVGVTVILARLSAGAARLTDIREAVRLGLIGGGMEPTKATALVRRYVDERPLNESAILARVILAGLLCGFKDPDEAAPSAPAIVTSVGDFGQPKSPSPVTIRGLRDIPAALPGQAPGSQRAGEGQPHNRQTTSEQQATGPISSRLRGGS